MASYATVKYLENMILSEDKLEEFDIIIYLVLKNSCAENQDVVDGIIEEALEMEIEDEKLYL